MKKVTKKLQKFIDSISIIRDSNIPDDNGKIYYSKVDGSYLTRVGMEDHLSFLFKFGIIEQIQDGFGDSQVACIGFNPSEEKWYGWSHRALYGFGIGSTCKMGDCGFKASNKEEFAQDCLNFWGDNKEYSMGDEKVELKENGVLVSYTYNDQVPNKALRGTRFEHFSPYPSKWGRGEWTAATLEEAKEMAIDFAKGVS